MHRTKMPGLPSRRQERRASSRRTIRAMMCQIPGVVELEQNTVFQDLEAYANVDFELTLVPEEGYKDKLNLMMASDDYPEVITHADFSNQDLEKYGVEETSMRSISGKGWRSIPNGRSR